MPHNSFLTKHNDKLVLVIVLNPENLGQLKAHEPILHRAEAVIRQVQAMDPKISAFDAAKQPIGNLDIIVCLEEDAEFLRKAAELTDSHDLMEWVARGVR